MAILNARSRLVSVRLTQEELENLRLACLVKGGRNVSDFARSAILQSAEAGVRPETQLLDRFSAIELRLAEIEATLSRQAELLRALLKGLANGPAARQAGQHRRSIAANATAANSSSLDGGLL
jgi:uncharacterized protein (DUF1778 family)